MPSYKFKYFDFKARGEISRLLFALKGQSYEDYRIPHASWAKEKAETPFGFLPVLCVDGKSYTDSMGIARFLANEFGFGGQNNVEQLQVDQVLGIVYDATSPVIETHFADASKKAELNKKTYEEKLPGYFQALEKILTSSGTGYFVGNKFTLADLAVFDLVDKIPDKNFVDKYPKVKANLSKTTSNENIKAYLKRRKPSDI